VFGCPVFLCEEDAEWLSREDKEGVRVFVDGTKEVVDGATMIRVGGHFDGSACLVWEGKLFHADSVMVVPVCASSFSLPPSSAS
jgi:glyoxylase-like metal-dependent hydrolase (beta-lactamase superfamily II)